MASAKKTSARLYPSPVFCSSPVTCPPSPHSPARISLVLSFSSRLLHSLSDGGNHIRSPLLSWRPGSGGSHKARRLAVTLKAEWGSMRSIHSLVHSAQPHGRGAEASTDAHRRCQAFKSDACSVRGGCVRLAPRSLARVGRSASCKGGGTSPMNTKAECPNNLAGCSLTPHARSARRKQRCCGTGARAHRTLHRARQSQARFSWNVHSRSLLSDPPLIS